MTESELSTRTDEFKERGYTIFRGFNAGWIEQWRPLFIDRYNREIYEDQQSEGVGQPRAVLRDLLQERIDLFLPPLVDPIMLTFLESLMGPFVGFDSLQVAITPSLELGTNQQVHAWHRDMWGLPGWTEDYLPPNAVNVLTYLQSGSEYGRLRVIPGSHRGSRFVDGDASAHEPDEQYVDLDAGDTVVIHSSLLHTTSGNRSGDLRIFASYFYTKCWLPKRDKYDNESIQKTIRDARNRGDRRVARLFEPDHELLLARTSDRGERSEQERWREWVAEDRTERESYREG